MRPILIVLIVLLVVLQQRLWSGDGGVIDLLNLNHQITQQKSENEALLERNEALQAEVEDLKTGVAAIEERARSELGMIKENETFYQAVIE